MKSKNSDGTREHAIAPLTDDALTQAAGGTGYTSVQCNKCGKTFQDLEEYRKHIEAGHPAGFGKKKA